MPTLKIKDNKGGSVDLTITSDGKLPVPASLATGGYLKISFSRNARTRDFHLEISADGLQLRKGQSARTFAKEIRKWIPREPIEDGFFRRIVRATIGRIARMPADAWWTIVTTLQNLAVVASALGLGFGLIALYKKIIEEQGLPVDWILRHLGSKFGDPMGLMVYSILFFAGCWLIATLIEFFVRVRQK